MKREYKDYVQDIWDFMERIKEFTINMEFDRFEKDNKTILAVEIL